MPGFRSQLAHHIAFLIGGDDYKRAIYGIAALAEMKRNELEEAGQDIDEEVAKQIAGWKT